MGPPGSWNDDPAKRDRVTVALKERMGRDRKENIEIARRAAVEACLTLTGKANPRAFLDAGGNIDCERAFLLHMTRAATGLAGVPHHATVAAALRASTFDREEALRRAHLAVAGTGSAGLWFGAGCCANPATVGARNQ